VGQHAGMAASKKIKGWVNRQEYLPQALPNGWINIEEFTAKTCLVLKKPYFIIAFYFKQPAI
jgi:hypothetical protein